MYNEMCPPNSTQHVVKEGDTFWRLSQSYGVSVQNLIDANPGINANNLQIGSILCIPVNSSSPASPHTCPSRTFSYTIRAGDTFWKLSQIYDVNVQDILDVNPGIDPQNLQIGSTVCIPNAQNMPAPSVNTAPQTKTVPLVQTAPMSSEMPPVACPKNASRYTIQNGDTFWKLSQAYGVDLQDIVDANPGINPQNLQIGSTLCIPNAQNVPAPFEKATPPAKAVTPMKTSPLTSEMPPMTCPKNTFRYTIQSGDTIWTLSQVYHVNVQDILDANPGIDPQNLQIGSTLCIPNAQNVPAPFEKPIPPAKAVPPTKTAPLTSEIPPMACPKNTFRYTIQSGDTLGKLSQVYGVNLQDIVDANPGVNPQNLQIGSTLCIPNAQNVPAPFEKPIPQANAVPPTKTAPLTSEMPPMACPKNTFRYTIQSGDTIWTLSQVYHVNIQDILDANPGIDPQNLQIGSTLCIPNAQNVPAPFEKPIPPAKAVPPTKTAPLTSEMPPMACPKNTFRYTIQSGDTIWTLSQVYHVNIQDILDANPGIDPQNLQIGSTLCIPNAQNVPAPFEKTTPPAKAVPPTKTAPLTQTAPPMPTVPQTAAAPSHFLYCIKRCDTIYGIARNFYVSVESILNKNPGINPRCLQVGTYIHIPVNCCGENTWRYTVREDDTLNRIANKLNVCPSAIVAANPNIDFQHLMHCQVICIPKE